MDEDGVAWYGTKSDEGESMTNDERIERLRKANDLYPEWRYIDKMSQKADINAALTQLDELREENENMEAACKIADAAINTQNDTITALRTERDELRTAVEVLGMAVGTLHAATANTKIVLQPEPQEDGTTRACCTWKETSWLDKVRMAIDAIENNPLASSAVQRAREGGR